MKTMKGSMWNLKSFFSPRTMFFSLLCISMVIFSCSDNDEVPREYTEEEIEAVEYLGTYPDKLGIESFQSQRSDTYYYCFGFKKHCFWFSLYDSSDKTLLASWTSDEELETKIEYRTEEGSYKSGRITNIAVKKLLLTSSDSGIEWGMLFHFTLNNGEVYMPVIGVNDYQGAGLEIREKYELFRRWGSFIIADNELYDYAGNLYFVFSNDFRPLDEKREIYQSIRYSNDLYYVLFMSGIRVEDGIISKREYCSQTIYWTYNYLGLFEDTDLVEYEGISSSSNSVCTFKLKITHSDGKKETKYLTINTENGEFISLKDSSLA